MPLLTLLIGALMGASLGHGFDATLAGGFIGLIAGLVISAWRKSGTQARAARSIGPEAHADDPFAHATPFRRTSALHRSLQDLRS